MMDERTNSVVLHLQYSLYLKYIHRYSNVRLEHVERDQMEI